MKGDRHEGRQKVNVQNGNPARGSSGPFTRSAARRFEVTRDNSRHDRRVHERIQKGTVEGEAFPAGIETSLSPASIEIRPVKANASGSPTA